MDKLQNLKSDEIGEFNLDDLDYSPVSDGMEPQGHSLENIESTDIIPRCEFLTGGAGTGKTYEIKRRISQYKEEYPNRDRSYGILAATTGIAAINLGDGSTTVNSVLKFFDISSLEDSYNSGKLQQALKEVSRVADNLVIDEISMMQAKVLDIIWDALTEINQHEETKERGGLGIIITGDFCQLPPVPDKDIKTGKSMEVKYAFESQCWHYFEANTTKLTKNWRQDDPKFVTALNHARRGEGRECSQLLREHEGVSWNEEIETNFDGTTIFSKNVEVDRLNQTRLRNLLHSGKKPFQVRSFRWGKQRGEWKNIPETLDLSEDCYVMILANDSRLSGFRYANGTTGYVEKFTPIKTQEEREKKRLEKEGDIQIEMDEEIFGLLEDTPTENTFLIRLRDKEMKVEIGKICRQVTQKNHPDEYTKKPEYDSFQEWKENNPTLFSTTKQAKFMYMSYLNNLTEENRKPHKFENIDGKGKCSCGWGTVDPNNQAAFQEHYNRAPMEIFFDYAEGRWVIGEIYYFPLRIAYASTVHKSQGLTLDRVQIDFINQFFGQPSMAYVALSRCKTAEGLRLVGSPKLLEERCNVSRKVMRFI